MWVRFKINDRIRRDVRMKTKHILWSASAVMLLALSPQVLAVDPIELSAESINSLSCSGSFQALAPLIPAYQDRDLKGLREDILNTQVSTTIRNSKAHSSQKPIVLNALDQQAKEHDRVANEAANMANQSDGRGSQVSINELVHNKLPLTFQCSAKETIHVGAVCATLINRWGSLVARYTVEAVKKCW